MALLCLPSFSYSSLSNLSEVLVLIWFQNCWFSREALSKNLGICLTLLAAQTVAERMQSSPPSPLTASQFQCLQPPCHGARYTQDWQELLGKLLFSGPWPMKLHDFREEQVSPRRREVFQLFFTDSAQKSEVFNISESITVCILISMSGKAQVQSTMTSVRSIMPQIFEVI